MIVDRGTFIACAVVAVVALIRDLLARPSVPPLLGRAPLSSLSKGGAFKATRRPPTRCGSGPTADGEPSGGSLQLLCINDELLRQFDLSPCVLQCPPRAPASPSRPTALVPVRLDRS